MIQLGLVSLHLLEIVDEARLGIISFQVSNLFRFKLQILQMHEIAQVIHSLAVFLYDDFCRLHKPYLPSNITILFAREQCDSLINCILLTSEIKDVPIGFRVV